MSVSSRWLIPTFLCCLLPVACMPVCFSVKQPTLYTKQEHLWFLVLQRGLGLYGLYGGVPV